MVRTLLMERNKLNRYIYNFQNIYFTNNMDVCNILKQCSGKNQSSTPPPLQKKGGSLKLDYKILNFIYF